MYCFFFAKIAEFQSCKLIIAGEITCNIVLGEMNWTVLNCDLDNKYKSLQLETLHSILWVYKIIMGDF